MRRYFQIRLRTALVLVGMCAVPCGWLSANLRQWRAEERVLAELGPATVENARRPYLCLL